MALSKGFELATLGSGLDVNQSTGEVVTISMDTDVVSEGTTNLYFTNERVDDRVANLLVGGSNITVTYDDTAGTLTIAGQSGYSDSDVDTHLNVSGASANQVLAWSGTDYIWANNPAPTGDSNRVVYDLSDPTNTIVLDPGSTIGTATYKGDVLKPDGTVIVDVSSTSTTFTGGLLGNIYGDVYNPTGANKILESGTGNLDSALTVDTITTSSNVIIGGNLTVNGTTTTLNTATLDVEDLNITVASGAADSAAANGAGLTVDGASANITYTHATTSWDFNKPVNVTGNIGVTGTVDGVDIAARDAILTTTTTTANAALPKTGGTMTGDISFGDNDKAIFGAGSDLQIYHDGTDSYIKNDTGKFRILGDQGNVAISVAAGYGNAVSLEYANSTKLQTTSSGVSMQYGATFGSGGDVISSNYQNGTSGQRYFQAKNSFQSGFTDGSIFGGMSFRNTRSNATPGITGYIRGVANGTNGNMNLEIITGTAGSLTQKVLIKDAGIDITGNIGVTGTVDGVDIAVNIPSTLGTAGQLLAVNTGATAGEWIDAPPTTDATKLPLAGGTMTGDVLYGDNVKAKFGTSSDLEIFHNGSNSYVTDNGQGKLILSTNGTAVDIYDNTNGHTMAQFTNNAGVTLSYQGSTKIATTSTGIDVTGNIAVSGTVDGVDIAARDAILTSTTTTANAALPKAGGTMTGNITFNAGQTFPGTGSLSNIVEDTTPQLGGDLDVNGKIITSASSGNIKIKPNGTGHTEFENEVKFIGTSYTTEWLSVGHWSYRDGVQARFGNSDDLKIYHNGTNSYIDDAGEGSLFIRSGTTYIQNAAGTKTSIVTNAGAGQTLYHNNTQVFVTTATGIDVTGTATMDGLTVDGNITTTGYIAGPATLTIDPAGVGDNTGKVVIAGDLQVDGTTTTINSTTLTVDDKNIVLASGSADAAAANGAGITVDGASATILYDGTNDEWDFNKDVNVTGTVTADGIFVDTDSIYSVSGTNRVGINKTSPATTLDVGGSIFFSSILRSTSGGSAASPSIQPGLDGDTGMFWPAVNTIGLTTGGTERMRIDASGRVGIASGGAVPDIPGTSHDTLVVGNNTTNTAGIMIATANGSGKYSSVGFYDNTGSIPAGRMMWDSGASELQFRTRNSGGTAELIQMSISNAGDVDIAGTLATDELVKITGVGTNTTYASDELGLSGFGIMGNRSNLYITNADSSGVIKLGIGGVHNSSNKLTISSTGITVAGNIAVSGTVDGRDVDADGTKLDGIETGATADQTKADIDALNINANTLDGRQGYQYVFDGLDNGNTDIIVNDADFVVRDTTDSITNFIWRDHSASKLYLGTANAQPITRYDLYTQGGSKYYHAGNDGAGSGLDADLLDGQQGSYYQKKTTVQDAVPSGATGEFWYESDTSVLHVYYGGAWVDVAPGLQTSDNLQINSLGVGTAASGTAGEIRATNDVTAYYSDARLKNFESTIDSALDKVKQLNGYYFTENEIAKELGYANDKRQVGVSAQEVEAVLPEIVTEAPISDEYLTVKYEKLAPLFIEAIKEIDEKYQAKQDQQQAQIDMLMEEIEKLKGN